MNLIERIKSILLNPKEEWPKIAAEPATVQSLYVGYIMILAAIGPIVVVVRSLFSGFGIGLPLLDKQGNSVSGAAGPYRIADYDHYTRVLAVAGTSNTCDGSILIIVDDVAPLSTWAGILGVIAALLGIIGLVATMFQFPSG